MKTTCKLALLATLLSLTVSAQAAMIPLFNTGVSAVGTPLPNTTTPDLHYSIISAPVGVTTVTRVLTAADGFPVPPWVGDNSLSAWIGPNTADAYGPSGTYIYRTTFDLTGLDPSTAMITGRWSTDNNGLGVLLNGIDAGVAPTSFTSFYSFSTFSISGGFVSGLNTLDFLVNNGPPDSPTGLRVEMTGTAAPVPEPSTMIAGALLLLPFGASTIRFFRKNRRA
jgi:hypothetical protein